ncbi:MAG: secretin N-terminal domain-containing protein [Pirellulales bacterium]
MIRELIRRVEDPKQTRGSAITTMSLKHITANEIFEVARPLLGLAEGSNTSEDISLATDVFGNTIFATGKNLEKLQKLRDLVTQLDVAPDETQKAAGELELPVVRTHATSGCQPELAFRVLSQLLAGEPDVRMELDEDTKMIVAQAKPSAHKLIDDTIMTLRAEGTKFDVIQLKNLDATLAIATIKKFFGLSDSGSTDSGDPVIDGDLVTRRLYVKASPVQLEQIKTLVEKLEANSAANDFGENIRVLPLTGRKADRALQQVEALWRATKGKNRIRIVMPEGAQDQAQLPQKSVNEEVKPKAPDAAPGNETKPAAKEGDAKATEAGATPEKKAEPEAKSENKAPATTRHQRSPLGRLVTLQQPPAGEAGSAPEGRSDEATEGDDEIVIMPGPGGLVITSNDEKALAQFDKLLRMMVDQGQLATAEPTFYYLKYIKASAAKELLEAILSGTTQQSSSGGGGGLLGNMMSEIGGGMIGSLLGSGGASVTSSGTSLTTGDVIITADPRLNFLVIRANPTDLDLCEQLLKIIDQDESPISLQTRGQIELIPVVSQNVDDVANTIRGIYGDRIEGAGGGGAQRQPNPQEIIQAITGGGGGRRGGGGASSELKETKISLGVDKNTNTLIVMAQPQDIADIRKLVARLDEAGTEVEETVTVATMGGSNLSVGAMDAAIRSVFGAKARTNTQSTSNPGSTNQPGGQPGQDDGQARRQAEMMQQLRDRLQQGGGAAGGRGGAPTGGATPGGGRGGFGGFGGGGFPGGFGGFGGNRGGGTGGGAPAGGGNRGGGR